MEIQSEATQNTRTGSARMSASRRLSHPDATRRIAAAIPVSLGKPSLRLRLEAYYQLIAPDVVAKEPEWRARFEQIWAKFGGTIDGEKRLAAKLAKKYGSSVRLLLAESNESAAMRSTVDSSAQRDEGWYQVPPDQRGSNVLDFTSKKFDPEAALRSDARQVVQANPFISNSARLDNLERFPVHLPRCDPLHRIPLSGQKRSRTSTTHVSKVPRNLPAFVELAQAHDQGPFSLLHQAFQQRCRLRVLIRYVNCVRGTLTGLLMAYDKHMNLILKDVEEVFTPRFTGDSMIGLVSNVNKEVLRRRRAIGSKASDGEGTWTIRRRHLKQILVRGDNVVMVYKAESERSAWPHTSESPIKSCYKVEASVTPESPMRVGTPGSLVYAQARISPRVHKSS